MPSVRLAAALIGSTALILSGCGGAPSSVALEVVSSASPSPSPLPSWSPQPGSKVVFDDGYRIVTEPVVWEKRTAAQWETLRAEIEALLAAGAPHDGGFGTGFDETGHLVITIPVIDRTEQQRALGDRVEREFAHLVTVWRAGSGPKWADATWTHEDWPDWAGSAG